MSIPEPRLIIFAGTVGSGKSTQMRLLASALKSRGVKVKISVLKRGHILAYFLEVVLVNLTTKRKDVYPIRALFEERPNFFKKIFKLLIILDIISISFKFLFEIFIPLKCGYVVLVEEYLPATIADYIFLSKTISFPVKNISFALKFIEKLMSLAGPMKVIFLDADTDVLRFRWKLRGSMDESLDYLNMQRTLLLPLLKMTSSKLFYIKTTNQTIKETHKQITDCLSIFSY